MLAHASHGASSTNTTTAPSVERGRNPAVYSVIVACGTDGGIARAGKIPWDIRADMTYFRVVTKGVSDPSRFRNAVVMGRTTWETLPGPLPGRLNVVVSSTLSRGGGGSCGGGHVNGEGVLFFQSLKGAVDHLAGVEDVETVFVIGGQELYREALLMPQFDTVHVSWVDPSPTGCDRFFPLELLNRWFESADHAGRERVVFEGRWTVMFSKYKRIKL